MLLAVMDGHGENGHLVSQFVRSHLPRALFTHPQFPADVGAALRGAFSAVEGELLRSECRPLACPRARAAATAPHRRRGLAVSGVDCRLSGST
ncbi:MAG: PP2C family serine/threonine-protein phosphatase, partial [Hydrogenophaga sp.]